MMVRLALMTFFWEFLLAFGLVLALMVGFSLTLYIGYGSQVPVSNDTFASCCVCKIVCLLQELSTYGSTFFGVFQMILGQFDYNVRNVVAT